jgi:TRAP-type C4-dicarboxylate transport system permease small subunit
MLGRWVLTALVVVALALSVLWAMLIISIGLYDSYGNFRYPGLTGIPGIFVGLVYSLSPGFGCLWALYRIWFRRRKLEDPT